MSTQALQALGRANAARVQMADLKRQAEEHGAHWLALRLERGDPSLARFRVEALICSLPRFGKDRAARVVKKAGITPTAIHWRVGPLYEHWRSAEDRTLTQGQRSRLGEALRRA